MVKKGLYLLLNLKGSLNYKMVKKALKSLKIPFGLAGVSIGSNLLGSALDSKLPAGTTNPLTSLGTSSAKVAGISGTIALTGIILEETYKLQPKEKEHNFKVPNIKLVKTYGKPRKGIL